MYIYLTYISFSKLHINSHVLSVWYWCMYFFFLGISFQWHFKGHLFLCRKKIQEIFREGNTCTLNPQVCSWWTYGCSLTTFWSSATCLKIEDCAWASPNPPAFLGHAAGALPHRQPLKDDVSWLTLTEQLGQVWAAGEAVWQHWKYCQKKLYSLDSFDLLVLGRKDKSCQWPLGVMLQHTDFCFQEVLMRLFTQSSHLPCSQEVM